MGIESSGQDVSNSSEGLMNKEEFRAFLSEFQGKFDSILESEEKNIPGIVNMKYTYQDQTKNPWDIVVYFSDLEKKKDQIILPFKEELTEDIKALRFDVYDIQARILDSSGFLVVHSLSDEDLSAACLESKNDLDKGLLILQGKIKEIKDKIITLRNRKEV
jgi:hypothetical protein